MKQYSCVCLKGAWITCTFEIFISALLAGGSSSITLISFILVTVAVALVLMLGIRWEYTLDGSPVHHR